MTRAINHPSTAQPSTTPSSTTSRRTMRLALALLAALWLGGCAVAPAPEPRSISLNADPDATLRATLAMFAERGFVIRHADGDLRQVDAVLASRSGYQIHAEVTTGDTPPPGLALRQGDTYLSLSGRQGGQPLDAVALDPLFIDVQNRMRSQP
ncbi:hypothetical protein [Salinicola halophilus]|uniref:hypothetical protein n=1 Tax=Salinicola halophilus TaxID=184065 RepID=UPI0013A5F724|nr:hypothetical protein [Salinicola halophilus]